MPHQPESKITVAPDSSGKAVRNLQMTVLIPDPTSGVPTPTTVQMQVLTISDEFGVLIDLDINPTLDELIAITRRMYALLRIIAECLTEGVGGHHGVSTEEELIDPAWEADNSIGST